MGRNAGPQRAYLALGSNLGDRLQACRGGIAALEQRAGAIAGRSKFYHTSPVGDLDQDWYLNCAVALETRLSPMDLLECCLDIEKRAGRVRTRRRFGPRVLDLDILFYDDLILNTPRLSIPHPRLHERRFVLRPLCDIDPQLHHPLLNRSVGVLLSSLVDPSQQIEEYPCDC